MNVLRFCSLCLVTLLLVASLGAPAVGSPIRLDSQEQPSQEVTSQEDSSQVQDFGDPLSAIEVTPIEAILADPAAWDGKTVRIEGRVGDVCPRQGCWMDLVAAGDGSDDKVLRVKVDDGVIVFPADARGSVAEAEGVVSVMDMSRDRYVSWLAHQAEEKGQDFDPSTVGEGPFQWIQVMGVGARLTRP